MDMKLKDTIELMISTDYKDRFVAEYMQLQNRYCGLDRMTAEYKADTLPFTPTCSLELLNEQKSYMGEYLRVLRSRAELEGIDLTFKQEV